MTQVLGIDHGSPVFHVNLQFCSFLCVSLFSFCVVVLCSLFLCVSLRAVVRGWVTAALRRLNLARRDHGELRRLTRLRLQWLQGFNVSLVLLLKLDRVKPNPVHALKMTSTKNRM